MSPGAEHRGEGAITLEEAVARVRERPEDGEAWEVVRVWLHKLVRGVTRDEDYRVAAVDFVFENLLDQAQSRDLPEIQSPRSYLRRALYWRVCSLARRRKSEAVALEAERHRREEQRRAEAEQAVFEDAMGVLERAHALAVKRRDAWQQEHLVRAWEQVKELILEDVTLRELVIRDDGLDPEDRAAITRAVGRAHKAHQRARAAVGDALEILIRRDGLDEQEAQAARDTLRKLRRRRAVRTATSPASSGQGT